MEWLPDNPPERPTGLTLQESLRTLALALDGAQVPKATLVVDPRGISVHTASSYGYRNYTWTDLDSLSKAQRAQRRPVQSRVPWLDPLVLTRWSVLLRVIGYLLDLRQITACTVEAAVAPRGTAGTCVVQVVVDDTVVLTEEDVHACVAMLRVDSDLQAPVRPRRWWKIWRRQ